MQQQATVRQPDETICFSCGTTVKRDAGACWNCGSRIAAGPPQVAAEPIVPLPLNSTVSVAVDEAGVGRYILNFVLAGLIGLGLTYFMRKQGWNATWISACIFVLVIAGYVATH